ncbi:MAG: hypothetical protein ACLGIA_11150 [Actinomycetes bacterium]
MARRPTMTMWAALETWDCSTCGEPMPFETLPCADGHDEDCPDRVCVGCGAVLVAWVAPLPGRRSA